MTDASAFKKSAAVTIAAAGKAYAAAQARATGPHYAGPMKGERIYVLADVLGLDPEDSARISCKLVNSGETGTFHFGDVCNEDSFAVGQLERVAAEAKRLSEVAYAASAHATGIPQWKTVLEKVENFLLQTLQFRDERAREQSYHSAQHFDSAATGIREVLAILKDERSVQGRKTL